MRASGLALGRLVPQPPPISQSTPHLLEARGHLQHLCAHSDASATSSSHRIAAAERAAAQSGLHFGSLLLLLERDVCAFVVLLC